MRISANERVTITNYKNSFDQIKQSNCRANVTVVLFVLRETKLYFLVKNLKKEDTEHG